MARETIITTKIGSKALRKLRFIKVYTRENLTEILDRLINEEFKKVKKEIDKEDEENE